MSDPLIIEAGSPSELIVMTPTADDVAIITGYQVAIVLAGSPKPADDSPLWQEPDVDGDKTGIMVGSATDPTKTFAQGDIAMPYVNITTAHQQVIKASPPWVQFV